MDRGSVLVLGSFVADVSFRMTRLPAWGETLMGSAFALGPGGKGSNQAVAASRAGACTRILTKLGEDTFGKIAREIWAEAGVHASLVTTTPEPTGSAAILIDERRGENAIVIVPGACSTLSVADVRQAGEAIRSATILLTQLELPLATVAEGLRLAKDGGRLTILNPAPAPQAGLSDNLLGLCDLLIPNETEAAQLTGLPVGSVDEAAAAAGALHRRGARHVIVTMAERGALICPAGEPPMLVPAFTAGVCQDTAGAGDAFCGALAAALAEGRDVHSAVSFACAAAAISVTRAGTAKSMPHRHEIDAVLSSR